MSHLDALVIMAAQLKDEDPREYREFMGKLLALMGYEEVLDAVEELL